MPIYKVTKVGKANSGKPIVYVDGKEGRTDGFLVPDKCTVPAQGMTIDAATKSWDYRGVTYWGLDGWTEIKLGGGGLSRESPTAGAALPAVDAPAKALAGWDIASGDLSRYASNIVASAITAGLIKEPSDIAVWSKAAYRAGEALKAGDMQGPDPSTHAGDPGREDGDPGFDGRDVPF